MSVPEQVTGEQSLNINDKMMRSIKLDALDSDNEDEWFSDSGKSAWNLPSWDRPPLINFSGRPDEPTLAASQPVHGEGQPEWDKVDRSVPKGGYCHTPLSYAALACVLLECRMAMAAALTASSSCSPERKKVMKLDRASFGQRATSPCLAKMAFTRSVHVEDGTASSGSPGAGKRKRPAWMSFNLM